MSSSSSVKPEFENRVVSLAGIFFLKIFLQVSLSHLFQAVDFESETKTYKAEKNSNPVKIDENQATLSSTPASERLAEKLGLKLKIFLQVSLSGSGNSISARKRVLNALS